MPLVEADYENGVLRPLKPLRLRSGERVHLILRRRADPARWNLDRLAKMSGDEDLELASAGLDGWAQALQDEDER